MDMVEYALENRVHLDIYCRDIENLEDDRLTEQDWEDLKAEFNYQLITVVTMLLGPFRKLTKMGQEKNTPFGSVLWGFDMLLDLLEKTREQFNIEKPDKNNQNQKLSHIATCIDHAWGLFTKYYELADKTEAYIAAMVLEKFKYFEHRWDPEHGDAVMQKTKALYEEFRGNDDPGALSSTLNTQQSNKRKVDNDDDDIMEFRFGIDSEEVQDELERYLNDPKLTLAGPEANRTFDLMAWWKANELVYPTLARMAFELFSIPSMSCEVERVFSRYSLKNPDMSSANVA
jgi:hypothetical protein